ncbi:MAG TPA: triose-phosphate isomerase [Chitinophagales bacterium]|nr:triose-phosphate isomerase [Chitinophagales bacterium]
MRKRFVAGNWKMNKFLTEGIQLAADILVNLQKNPPATPVILCPPFIHLSELAKMLKECSFIKLGAQNCHYKDSGAFTGEVSAPMLSSIGVDYVITGHSERRQYFFETDEIVLLKVKAVLAHGLKPIFCCGEPLEVRQQNKHFDFVSRQVNESLLKLTAEEMKSVVIAYEPIWAIGTGVNATPAQAQEMHAFIRELLSKSFGSATAVGTTILYGGSLKPDNAKSLFSQPDVDGGLVGGASLVAGDFVRIVRSLELGV